MPPLFHLAFPVHDLTEAKRFYVDGLGCHVGRESDRAVTFCLGGHQIVAQLDQDAPHRQRGIYPRHFGLIFRSHEEWRQLADRAKTRALKFYQEPRRRFPGTRIEHWTFFLEDPSHNLLEFKHYLNESAIFGEHEYTEVGDTEERR